MAFRVDIGSLRAPKRLPNGQIRVDGVITRTGVFTYRNADGSERREYRPPEEVFRDDAMNSFAQVPVTDDHPPVAITSTNSRQYARGSTGEVIRKDGDNVIASLAVFDADLVKKMESGKVSLSCGYEVDLEMTPGKTEQGERYDAIQRNIRGNHVAIVDVPRAGPAARVRMDAEDFAELVQVEQVRQDRSEQTMEELKKALAELATEKVRADQAETKAAAEKARADGLQIELDAERKQRADSDAGFASRVSARVALLSAASKILGEVKLDAMTDREVRVAVVKKVDGDEVPASEHDAYVAGRYDSAVKRAAASTAAAGATRAAAEEAGRQDNEDPEQVAMRKAREDSIRNSRAPIGKLNVEA